MSYYRTCPDCRDEEKELPSATNTEQLKAETITADSASSVHEETEESQV